MHLPLWLILVIIYQVKHFIADYPAQSNKFMLGKFRPDWGFFLPLLAHASVHAGLTFLIAIFLVSWKSALALATFDATIHFMMDRIKASPEYLGRFKPLTAETIVNATSKQLRHNTYFWWSLGFDQAIHHLTHYAIIWYLIVNTSFHY